MGDEANSKGRRQKTGRRLPHPAMPKASPRSGLSVTELLPFIRNSTLTNTEARVSIPQGPWEERLVRAGGEW